MVLDHLVRQDVNIENSQFIHSETINENISVESLNPSHVIIIIEFC